VPQSEPDRAAKPEESPAAMNLSRGQFRELLMEALEDPELARLAARKLGLPASPVQGGQCAGPSARDITSGDFGANCSDSGNYTFASGGNVGIGTTGGAILAPLSIKPSSDVPQLYLAQYNNDNGGWMFRAGVDGHLHVISNQSGQSEKMTILYDNGNVGIGTTGGAILAPLSIKPSSDVPQLYLAQYNNDNGGWMFRAGFDGHLHVISNQSGQSEKMTILYNNGNVGIGTDNPAAPLHVKGGGITVEDNGGAGRLEFRQTNETSARTQLYRDSADFMVLRNWQQVYSILKIWAPQESSFPTTPREATVTLLRALDDESKTEFLDLYNNYYNDEKQYGSESPRRGAGPASTTSCSTNTIRTRLKRPP
jgi:hypothetical protein